MPTTHHGDTIYLPGTTYSLPANINKSLKIIGSGYYTDSTLATGKTVLNGTLNLNDSADNLYLEGVEIIGNIKFINDLSIDQVNILRCKFTSLIIQGNLSHPVNNLAVIGCVIIGNITIPNLQTGLLSNSIIQGLINNSNAIQYNNCIFLSNESPFGYTSLFENIHNNTLRNNIFLRQNILFITGSGNTFIDNLFVINITNFGAAPTLIVII